MNPLINETLSDSDGKDEMEDVVIKNMEENVVNHKDMIVKQEAEPVLKMTEKQNEPRYLRLKSKRTKRVTILVLQRGRHAREPTTHNTLRSEERTHWVQEMENEINTIEETNWSELVDKPVQEKNCT